MPYSLHVLSLRRNSNDETLLEELAEESFKSYIELKNHPDFVVPSSCEPD